MAYCTAKRWNANRTNFGFLAHKQGDEHVDRPATPYRASPSVVHYAERLAMPPTPCPLAGRVRRNAQQPN